MSVELLSVHVPKTGGTAFREVLETVYGSGCIHSVYPKPSDGLTGKSQEEIWSDDSLDLCRRRVDVPRVVHGHYLLTMYADRFPHARKIAWLRNPVDRLISSFYWWRMADLLPVMRPLGRAVREGRLELLDFVRSPAMRDQVTIRFLGDPAGRGLAFIGILERFDEDLTRLRTLLDWPPLAAPRSNVNESREYLARSVDEDVRSEIAALNPADVALYETVLTGRWRPAAGAA
jgi:hypothetical protein